MDHDVKLEQSAASNYFHHLRFLQSSIANLDLAGHEYTNAQLITNATMAFQRSAFNKGSITTIYTEWLCLDSAKKSANPGTYSDTKLERFMAHYEQHTNALWEGGCSGCTSAVANAVTPDLSSCIDDLQERFDAQLAMGTTPATAIAQSNGYTPNGAGTDASNGTAAGTGTGTPAVQTFRNPRHTEWKQWKYNCYSCGVNLNHDTRNHPKSRPKLPDHDDHLDATFQDQQGGNAKKNHLWLKWYNPTTA